MKFLVVCNSKTCFHIHIGRYPNWFQLRYDYLSHVAPATGWIERVIELVVWRVGGGAEIVEQAIYDALRRWMPQPERRPFAAFNYGPKYAELRIGNHAFAVTTYDCR